MISIILTALCVPQEFGGGTLADARTKIAVAVARVLLLAELLSG